ncbi:uncharacterized protein AKAME5_001297700 [Lates japonicus]|uniref:Uncharacterized protein n=1 Tax=Lates japonicus TaxID=270547 RepID=A0AAD3MX80_LATJO|nr:uncharacterized protein AKAME5_001297700 [Lates japonicus]
MVYAKYKSFSSNRSGMLYRYNITLSCLTNTEQEVQYTDIQICEDRHSWGGNLPDSSGTVDSHLKTVYDKLEVHRMVPLHTVTADIV